MPNIADYAIMVEFDNVSDLRVYLEHPAHEELSKQFAETIEAPLILDFESVGLNSLREPPAPSPNSVV
jgi:hypothetical protein